MENQLLDKQRQRRLLAIALRVTVGVRPKSFCETELGKGSVKQLARWLAHDRSIREAFLSVISAKDVYDDRRPVNHWRRGACLARVRLVLRRQILVFLADVSGRQRLRRHRRGG